MSHFRQPSNRTIGVIGARLCGIGLLLVGLCLPSASWAQREETDSLQAYPYQVGVPSSSLFKLLEEGDPTRQDQIYGRYWPTPRRMQRVAVRYRHVVGENSEVDVGLRGGLAWIFRGEERWRFYAGGDVVTGYRRFANGGSSYRGGISPLFGTLFFIHPHVSLSFEPRLVAAYARSTASEPGRSSSGVFSIEIDGTALLILSVHF